MRGYAGIVAPLNDLLKKDVFLWTEEATSSFIVLKGARTHTPMLAFPYFEQLFIIETDACNSGNRAVLQGYDQHISIVIEGRHIEPYQGDRREFRLVTWDGVGTGGNHERR